MRGPQDPQDPRNMGTFGLSIRGGAGRPPGEDGGGERGATMPTTSGVESGRPWSDLSTRESKAVIEGILSRVPTPPRTPTDLHEYQHQREHQPMCTSTNTNANT